MNQKLWEIAFTTLKEPMHIVPEGQVQKFLLKLLKNVIPLLSFCTYHLLRLRYGNEYWWQCCSYNVMDAVHYLDSSLLTFGAVDDLEFFMDLNEQDCSLQLKCLTDLKDRVQRKAEEGKYEYIF